MTDWAAAQQAAAKTARWSVTMTKVRIRRFLSRTKWQLVTFTGPAGGESVGIVDMVAIRRDHRPAELPGKRGDLFEIVLIQVKGGGAAFPTSDEVHRLRRVARKYHAKAVLLAQWKRGRQAEFYRLRKRGPAAKAKDCWEALESLAEVFR
ncbi:MAG TPA: hypothetical protein VMF30_16850 [Pirellulales bacterium]|nr:hypothetical protein [Pirellulales bacterium]